MRTLVDANVVLRYMLHDDEMLFPIAEQAIRDGAYLLPEVLAEVVETLGSGPEKSDNLIAILRNLKDKRFWANVRKCRPLVGYTIDHASEFDLDSKRCDR